MGLYVSGGRQASIRLGKGQGTSTRKEPLHTCEVKCPHQLLPKSCINTSLFLPPKDAMGPEGLPIGLGIEIGPLGTKQEATDTQVVCPL